MLIGIDARMYKFSGIGTYLQALLKGLGEIDRENRYICYFSSKDAPAFRPPSENFSVKIWDAPIYSIREQIVLPFQIRKEPFDVFHFPHYAFPVLSSCPCVISVHDIIHYLFPQYLPNRPAYYYAKFMISACLKAGKVILADSENTRNDLIKHFNADPGRVRVVNPALPEAPNSKEKSVDEARVLKKFGVDKPYLLYVGNCKEHKNIPMLVRAFGIVSKKSGHRLLVSCKRDEVKGLGTLVEDLGLEASITFLGSVEREDLMAIYSNASVFVFPSLYEGFGYPPLEAMSHGVPVICSNASSLPEVVGDAAVLVPPGSVEVMAESIYNVLNDEKLRKSLSEKGLKRSESFHYRAMAEKVLAAYREAAET